MPRPLTGGPTKFGPFWLEARLAVGGTAEVYIARPVDVRALPAKLVVKRLLPHFVADPEGRTMFEREAALHAAVHHDNVVEVFGSGVDKEEPWLAMEWVDGCDLFRLLRRLASGGRPLARGVSVFIARALLRGLESVHTARDATGQPMVIIHRDVTPSNVYLGKDGTIKLGDFGIARSATRSTLATQGGPMLKGKFAYLAPEQVAGEGFDQRADLFSTAVVLAEMLLGRPLFAGSGQLAVLLAIRDCRIDPLRAARESFASGLFEVLERALARQPAARFPTAAAFAEALAPFDPNPSAARTELAALVRWVQSAPSTEQMQAVRDVGAKVRAASQAQAARIPSLVKTAPFAGAVPATSPAVDPDEPVDSGDVSPGPDVANAHRVQGVQRDQLGRRDAPNALDAPTGEYTPMPSFVTTAREERLGPWPFARLVEAIATGEIGRSDRVSFMGRPPAPLSSIEELTRFLPTLTAETTSRMGGVGTPDFVDEVSPGALVRVLLSVVESEGTGVLFAEGPAESRRDLAQAASAGGHSGRKELYFVNGKLSHIASSSASELLGEYLVRRNAITRAELEFTLAVLPRYGGRIGDTLVSLGLLSSLDIFQAIREQGRDRLVDLFQWKTGTLTFYKGQTAPHVEFPLDLALPPLVFAGLEASTPSLSPLETWRPRLASIVKPAAAPASHLRAAPWPQLVQRVLDSATLPRTVRDLVTMAAQGDPAATVRALLALEILLAAKLLTID